MSSFESFETNLIEFIYNTMCGQESGIFKSIVTNTLDIPLTTLKTPLVLELFNEAIVDYLNQCYRSLILKNDIYIIKTFEKIKNSSPEKNHSYICLLNIIAYMILFFHKRIIRENLDISSYNNYMTSFTDEFNNVYSKNICELRIKFNHVCKDTRNIEDMDPDVDIFKTFLDIDDVNKYKNNNNNITIINE